MKLLRWLLPFALALHTAAQITLVNHVAVGAGTSAPISTVGANLSLVCGYQNYGSPAAPTDSSGNAYTLVSQSVISGYSYTYLWAAWNPVTSATETFTPTNGTIAAMAFKGVASGPDQTAAGNGGQPSFSTGSITPTKANELVASCFGGTFNTTPAVSSAPYAKLDIAYNSSLLGSATAYQIQTTATSVNASWTNNEANGAAALQASFFSVKSPLTLTTTTTNLPSGNLTVAYSVALKANGGVSPYTWSLTKGGLPPGLSLSASGVISGTPTTAGTYSGLVFQVKDHAGTTATTPTLSIMINEVPPVITTTGCPSAVQYATSYNCTLAVTGGTPPYTWSYSSGQGTASNLAPDSLVPGLAINPSTGIVGVDAGGQILGMGIYNTKIMVADSTGTMANRIVTFPITGDTSFLINPPFPANSIFSQSVAGLPVDSFFNAVGLASGLHLGIVFGPNVQDGGIPVIKVPSTQALVPTSIVGNLPSMFAHGPWSIDTPIEKTANNSNATSYISDGHSTIVQLSSTGSPASEWEMYTSQYISTSVGWEGDSQGYWSLTGYAALTQDSGEGTDAAGLPVAAYLANVDAVMSAGGQRTAIRFTLPGGYQLAYHEWPATGQSGGGACTGGYQDGNKLLSQIATSKGGAPSSCSSQRIPFGSIWRIKAGTTNPCSAINNPQGYSLFNTLTNYGMIDADNGEFGIVGTPDPRWNPNDLACLTTLTGAEFEPVLVQQLAADWAGTASDDIGTDQVINTSQIALVNHVAVGSGTSAPISTVGANLSLVCGYQNYGSPAAPRDSSGNTYTLVSQSVISGYSYTYLWATWNPATSATETFTPTNGTLTAMAFKGVTSGPDQTAAGTGGQPSFSTGSITPTKANELVVSCFGGNSTATPAVSSAPYSKLDLAYDGSLLVSASAYQIQTTATTVNTIWKNNANNGAAALQASFF